MAKRWVAAAFAVAVLFIGIFIGAMFYSPLTTLFAPSDHKKIAESILVYDATRNRYQNLRYERSGRSKMLAVTPLFTLEQKEYQYSFWTWTYDGDINAAMCIWGPDEYGDYWVEISKLSGNTIDVIRPDGYIVTNITYVGWVQK